MQRYKRAIWVKTTSVAVMVFFLKSIISKVLDHNDVQSSLSTIMKHLDNGIWKTPYTEDFTNIGVKPATRHLNYYCMLLFLSDKPSF